MGKQQNTLTNVLYYAKRRAEKEGGSLQTCLQAVKS
jgi:hypothetical protein